MNIQNVQMSYGVTCKVISMMPVDLIIYAYVIMAHCAVNIIAHCALVPVPGDEDAILAL